MRVEQEQKVTEDARIAAEQDVAAQKYAVHVLQVWYPLPMNNLTCLCEATITILWCVSTFTKVSAQNSTTSQLQLGKVSSGSMANSLIW